MSNDASTFPEKPETTPFQHGDRLDFHEASPHLAPYEHAQKLAETARNAAEVGVNGAETAQDFVEQPETTVTTQLEYEVSAETMVRNIHEIGTYLETLRNAHSNEKVAS